MSDGQVKKYSARSYCLECPALFGNRTSKNLGVLVHRTSEYFKIFLPLHRNTHYDFCSCWFMMTSSNKRSALKPRAQCQIFKCANEKYLSHLNFPYTYQ